MRVNINRLKGKSLLLEEQQDISEEILLKRKSPSTVTKGSFYLSAKSNGRMYRIF